MESYRSGTTTERIVRTGILAAVLVLYSGWSFRDGYYAYPLHKNLPKLLENLPVPVPPSADQINPAVTAAAGEAIQKGDSADQVIERLGEPVARDTTGTYHIGPAGMIVVYMGRSGVTNTQWIDGVKTELDLRLQKIIGVVTGLLGLLMVLQLVRALTTRVELTEAGLRVNSQGGLRFGGSPLVPLDEMVGLKTDHYAKKGWVQVEYKLASGREGTVSLNDYIHKAFPEIVHALCEHHGWEDPIKARLEARAAEAAGAGDGAADQPAAESTVETQSGE